MITDQSEFIEITLSGELRDFTNPDEAIDFLSSIDASVECFIGSEYFSSGAAEEVMHHIIHSFGYRNMISSEDSKVA